MSSLKVLLVEGKKRPASQGSSPSLLTQRYLLNMESPLVEWTIQQILKIYPDHCDFDIVDVEDRDIRKV